MTAGVNTYSNISALVQSIYEDAMLVARENNLAANLVTVFNDRSGMATRKNFEYGSATINSIAEEDDLSSQAFTPSELSTLTPAEFGAQFLLTDQRIETDFLPVRQDAAQELGAAMGAKIDADILGDFNSLTGGTIGTTGATITWGYFFAMLSVLRGQFAPLPYVCVMHPYQWHHLGKAVGPGATVTNSPAIQDAVLRNFYVGSVSGVDIYTSSNVEASGNDAYCAMFSRPALAFDQRRAPRLEPERDASRRAYELNLSAVYAHGVWRPKWGVQGIFVATAPTS